VQFTSYVLDRARTYHYQTENGGSIILSACYQSYNW